MMITDRSIPWRKSSRSSDSGGNCVEVASVHDAPWRKSSRSTQNGQCVEVGCLHDASWRKSSHSANNGDCLEAAQSGPTIAVRDSKLPTTGDFPVLTMTTDDRSAMLNTLHV